MLRARRLDRLDAQASKCVGASDEPPDEASLCARVIGPVHLRLHDAQGRLLYGRQPSNLMNGGSTERLKVQHKSF